MIEDKAIMGLLNEARRYAVQRLHFEHGDKVVASQDNLDTLARYIRTEILIQAAGGRWGQWGVTRAEEFWPLIVTAKKNPGMVGPAILVHEDFSKTRLPMLQVL